MSSTLKTNKEKLEEYLFLMTQDEAKALGKKQGHRYERSHLKQSKLHSNAQTIIQSPKKLNCPCQWFHG